MGVALGGCAASVRPCAVGSLTPELQPGAIVVPDQLVDRTRRRADTYFDTGAAHVSFADPYCPTLRSAATGLPGVVDGGTMVVIEVRDFPPARKANGSLPPVSP